MAEPVWLNSAQNRLPIVSQDPWVLGIPRKVWWYIQDENPGIWLRLGDRPPSTQHKVFRREVSYINSFQDSEGCGGSAIAHSISVNPNLSAATNLNEFHEISEPGKVTVSFKGGIIEDVSQVNDIFTYLKLFNRILTVSEVSVNDHIFTFSALDNILSSTANQNIVSFLANQLVLTLISNEEVIVVATDESIVARAALYVILTFTALDHVIAAIAKELVFPETILFATAANYVVAAFRTNRVSLGRSSQHIISGCSDQAYASLVAADINFR